MRDFGEAGKRCRSATRKLLIGGDLIMSIDGKPVDRDDAISRALSKKRTGDTLELTIFRNGKTINVRVRLGDEGAI